MIMLIRSLAATGDAEQNKIEKVELLGRDGELCVVGGDIGLGEPAVLGPLEVGAGELAAPLPVVGIATPIFLVSAAALPVNRARKSPAPAVGFEALAGVAADKPASENELIEVR